MAAASFEVLSAKRLARPRLTIFAGAALLLAAPLLAEEPVSRTKGSIFQPDIEVNAEPEVDANGYATGTWGGDRDRWHDAGVDVFAFYNNIVSGNVVGGLEAGHVTYDHDIWVGIKFDLKKLIGWTGGQFVISGINRDGDDLTAKYIGSIYSTQQLVGGQRTFLYQIYLQQKLLADRLTLKVGRFGASDDFNASPLYGYSLNNAINGDIRNVLFDTRFSAYPFSTWSGALFYDPTPEFHLRLGAFQVSEGMFENDDNDLNFGIGSRDGFMAVMEIAWTPELFKRPAVVPSADGKTTAATVSKGLPGHYWFGVTYSPWDLYRRFGGGFDDHSYGFYAHADQMIFQEAPERDQGLTVFVASGYYPQEEISRVPFQVNVGFNYKGLFPSRESDHTMVNFIYGYLSRDYARAVQAAGKGHPDSEKVFELAHRFQMTPWSYFQPDLQWVIHPGGTGRIPNAVVIGAQMGMTF